MTSFTQFITQINFGRFIEQKITPTNNLGGFLYPLIASLSYCTENKDFVFDGTVQDDFRGIQSYLRPNEAQTFPADYLSLKQNLTAERSFFKQYLQQEEARIFGPQQVLVKVDHERLSGELRALAQMRWILDAAGIDASDLSTSLFGTQSLISAPGNAPIDFLTALYELRPEFFKGIDVNVLDLGTGRASWIVASCEPLKKQSLMAERQVAEKSQWSPYEKVANSRPVLSRCAKCHVEHTGDRDLGAPDIPFNNPALLAKKLRANEFLQDKILSRVHIRGRGQMPPEEPLTKQEIASLEAYLSVLSGR